MMGTGLLDTSTFIRAADLDPELLPETPVLSAITVAELAVGPRLAVDAATRELRERHRRQAERLEHLPFDSECAQAYAEIAAALRGRDHKRKARAFDALIAATAIANHLPLYTGNPADFEDITALDLRPVPAPKGG